MVRFSSGGDTLTIISLNSFISLFSLEPSTFNSRRWEASAFTLTDLPGSAKTGCSEKLGNTNISVVGISQGIS